MKKIIISIALLLTVTVASAQTEATSKHEYSVYLTGGMSKLVYKQNSEILRSTGKTKGGFGGGAGLGYTYNISQKFGIVTGLELSTYKGENSCGSLSEEYNGTDSDGNKVRYRYSISNYRESQTLAMISIPLMAQYKTPISGSMYFYAAGGLKLGFPVNAESKINADEVSSSGYYEFEAITYDDMPEQGFFTEHSPQEQKSKIETGFPAILSLESGIRFTLGKNAIYTGVYFDYALDMQESRNRHPLNYNHALTYESVLNSALADKLNLMSVGLKVKFKFN